MEPLQKYVIEKTEKSITQVAFFHISVFTYFATPIISGPVYFCYACSAVHAIIASINSRKDFPFSERE